MAAGSVLAAFCSLLAFATAGTMMDCHQPSTDNTTIYDFSLMDIMKEKHINLSDYKGKQEPGFNGTEILNGVKHVRPGHGFVPNFQLFEKIEVNGANEHGLYTYLKKYCPPTAKSFKPDMLFYSPIKASDVMWNWETFLVDSTGRVIKRAPPYVPPETLETDILTTMSADPNLEKKTVVG